MCLYVYPDSGMYTTPVTVRTGGVSYSINNIYEYDNIRAARNRYEQAGGRVQYCTVRAGVSITYGLRRGGRVLIINNNIINYR